MSKIIDIEYIYKKENKYNNAMYIYIGFLILLIIIFFYILYKK